MAVKSSLILISLLCLSEIDLIEKKAQPRIVQKNISVHNLRVGEEFFVIYIL